MRSPTTASMGLDVSKFFVANLIPCARRRHGTDLGQKRHHVEVVANLPDLVPLELDDHGCASCLLLPARWDRSGWPCERAVLRPLPRDLQDDDISRSKRAVHGAAGIGHGALPLLH